MTVLTVMLAAAFVMVGAEFRTTNGSYSSTRALNVAQAGLQAYLNASHSLGTGYDSANYSYTGGYARVVARKLRDSTGTSQQLWVVYATGIDTIRTTNRGSAGGVRVASTLATLGGGVLPAPAAMVASNGMNLTGAGLAPGDGHNANIAVAGCTQAGAAYTVYGLMTVKNGGAGQPYYPNGYTPNGGIDSLASQTAVNNATRIAWSTLLAGQFTPDYYNQLPAPNGTTFYSSYYPSGGVTIPGNTYRGLLVASGDVTLSVNTEWDGIIIAGGRLVTPTGNKRYTIYGMVITGLNTSLGQTVNSNAIDRGGTATIQFDYCYTRLSMSSLSYLVPVKGTYSDSWKTW